MSQVAQTVAAVPDRLVKDRSAAPDLRVRPTVVNEEMRVVRVWLGAHEVLTYENNAEAAESFERAIRRRYASCRVTNDPVSLSGEEALS